ARSNRLGAGNDLDQLLGNHRLTGAVIRQRLLADHFSRVARGVVHRSHLRTVERGGILQQRAENLYADVARQELDENFVFIGLVFVDDAIIVAAIALEHGRNDLLRRRDLRNNGPESRKEQSADIECTLFVEPHDFFANVFGVLKRKRANRAQLDVFDDLFLVETAKLLVALAAHAEELDLFAFGHQRIRPLTCEPYDRRVEGAAQATLGGAYQQQMHAVAAGSDQQPRRRAEVVGRGGDIAEPLRHPLGIGTRSLGRRLRAPQLRRRDHLHRLGDLLRRLGGGDAHAHVLEAGHVSDGTTEKRMIDETSAWVRVMCRPSSIDYLASVLRPLW